MGSHPALAQRPPETEQHTGQPFLPAEQAWLITLDAEPSAGGALDGDHVYVPLGPRSGEAGPQGGTERIVALDRESGRERWTRDLASRWTPAVAHGRVLVAAADGIHALEAATGVSAWHVAVDGRILAPPMVSGPLLVALTATGGLAAWRLDDGAPLWQLEVGAADGPAAMAIDERAVFLSFAGGRLVRVSLDGRRTWERTLTGTLGAPALTRDRLLVGSTDNYLYALDPDDGGFEWRFPAGADVIGAAAAGDDAVFFVALDNVLRALDRGSGNQRWKALLGTRPSAPPRVFDRTVLVSGFSPALAAFAADTGASLGTYAAPSDLIGPALVDPAPQPFRVAIVAITGDGRVAGLVPTGMQFREPAPAPLTVLPGRALTPEDAPAPAAR